MLNEEGGHPLFLMNFFTLTEDLTVAYFDTRRHKRPTYNQLEFELNLEHNLCELASEIWDKRYSLKPSICFIVDKPVKREIFAANFRDRVVHHYVIGNLTSQKFANVYVSGFDRWIKEDKGCRFYGRYVDDFYTVGSDAKELSALIPDIREFLHSNELLFKAQSSFNSYLGITKRAVEKQIKKLRERNILTRQGSAKNGLWVINR